MPPAVLKMCGSTLCKPLSIIFSRSLPEGGFPQLWKTSFISPIFKKGCKKNICNYRPIAKLSCIRKVFEKLVYNLIKHDCYKVISSHLEDLLLLIYQNALVFVLVRLSRKIKYIVYIQILAKHLPSFHIV